MSSERTPWARVCAAAALALGSLTGAARAEHCMPVYGRIELLLELGGPSSLVAADLDGDGRPDLVAVVNGRLVVSLNDGSGHFLPPVTLAAGDGPITLGDFNGDGHVDLAFANRSAGIVQIFAGSVYGTFAPTQTLPAPPGRFLSDVAAGDFDGDGATDLAVLLNALTVEIHFQRERGLSDVASESFVNGYQLKALDLNRDGRTDLLVSYAQFGGGNLYSFLSKGDGTFSWVDSGIKGGGYHLGYVLAAGDVDGDGNPDVAVVDSGNGAPATLRVFRNEPAGFFEATTLTLDRLYARSAIVADFDGDGRQEIGVGVNNLDGALPELLVYRIPDASRLVLASRQPLPIAASITVTDVDGDGLADLILWESGNPYTPFLMRGACPPVAPPAPLRGWPTPAGPRRRPSGTPANQSLR